MVRRAALRVDGYVFVLPEQVDGVAEYPFYGKVTSLSDDTATVRSIDLDEPVTCNIDVTSARAMTVTKAEATRTRPRLLLRQAAWTESASGFWHGQVIGIDGRLAQLQLEDRVVLVEPSRLTPVAPVVVFSYFDSHSRRKCWRSGLQRNPGNPGWVLASTATSLVTTPTNVLRRTWRLWTRTKREHAVDYAFAVDGDQPAPPALRESVGATFCDDPLTPAQPSIAAGPSVNASMATRLASDHAVVERANSVVSLFAQEESFSPGPSPRTTRHQDPQSWGASTGREFRPIEATPVPPTSAPVQHAEYSHSANHAGAGTVGVSLDARIMELLLHQPELLARFVQVVTAPSAVPVASASHESEPGRRMSKYSFAPTPVQISIHNSITSLGHGGKPPSVYVETVIYATAVRFQPHPGIIIRLYDFQFGMLGLSILHFAPFGVHQRLAWLNTGGTNMQNFSAGVTVPRPGSASSMGDLVDCARILSRYGHEFFVQPVWDVLDSLLDFLQQLDGWHTWLAPDLPHLVYWINSVLEQFRSFIHSSNGNSQLSSLQTIARLSLNNGELQNVMHALARRSTQTSLQTTRPAAVAATRERNPQRQPRIPPAIFDLIPTHNGLPICLRYLSAMGCPSGTSNRCVYGPRAHAAPDTLDARVKGHIIQRMGGDAQDLHVSWSSPCHSLIRTPSTQNIQRTVSQVSLSLSVAAHVRAALVAQFRQHSEPVAHDWFRRLGLPSHSRDGFSQDTCVSEQKAASNYASRQRLTLPDLVRQRRGEYGIDPRPNKGLEPDRLRYLLHGYPFVDTLEDIARHGIHPSWKSDPPPQQRPPKNHNSAGLFLPALMKGIRQGQADGTYLVVNMEMLQQWENVRCSPFGAVEKKGVSPLDEVRPIHDLSYSSPTSTNDYYDADCSPEISYICVVVVAQRIEKLAIANPGLVVKILKGDVKSAFRHLMMHANHVHWMGATIPEENALVIDLAAPFGWSGSPAFYSSFGRAISWLLATNSPASVSESTDDEHFFGYEWVDDHILVEPDRDDRLDLAESTFRLSMMAVLGPSSINDAKFSSWSTELQALGLVWNTVNRTVSMPADKVTKCLDRVSVLLTSRKATKKDLQKLLGSLRHLTTCLRSAKPFFQQLQVLCTRLRPFQTVQLSESSRRDLQWFRHILSVGHLEHLPLRLFGSLPSPDINIYMDASDIGLTVLHPAKNEFIQLRFDAGEVHLVQTSDSSGFTINVREHF